MRISDCSSDVCSSDLGLTPRTGAPARRRIPTRDGSMSMHDLSRISGARQQRALWRSTFALAVCFAVWVIFSIVGIQLQQDLGLSGTRSEEHTSELQSLMRISYAVFCLKKKKTTDYFVYLCTGTHMRSVGRQ